MNDDAEFYTQTMARVYTDQGYWEKAAEIYQYLLDRDPDRMDLIDALSEVRKKRSDTKRKDEKSLVLLFSKWFDLMLIYNRLQKLKKL